METNGSQQKEGGKKNKHDFFFIPQESEKKEVLLFLRVFPEVCFKGKVRFTQNMELTQTRLTAQ